jgi:hypothetical protein
MSEAGGDGAVRAAGRRTAPRKRTWGEPIFVSKIGGNPRALKAAPPPVILGLAETSPLPCLTLTGLTARNQIRY